jgi:multidrug resistance efflux pump
MIMHGNKTRHRRIHLTTEQRLSALECAMADLGGRVERLDRKLKEQDELIAEHITKQMVAATSDGARRGAIRPEDALYTFVCRQKFDHVEKELARLRRSLAKSRSLHKAG